MTANACFLHQLRHDVFAWRWWLGLYWALLLLSFPSLFIYQHSISEFLLHDWNSFLLNALPGTGTLLVAMSLAGLVESATPYDPEGFGRTRPVRMDMVLGSRLTIYFAGFLLPWMLQQVLLCHLAAGAVPWQDLGIRLVTGILPYAAGFAFAVILGSTARQKMVLAFAALLFLYFVRVGSYWKTDGVFAVMPDRAQAYLAGPKQIFLDYSWASTVPQPERFVTYQLLLLLIGVVSLAMAWRRFSRILTPVFFCATIIACGTLMEHAMRRMPPHLTASQEQALGLEKIIAKVQQPKLKELKEMTLPGTGLSWQLEFRPSFEQLPPTACAMMAVDPATLSAPGRQAIDGMSELYAVSPSDQNLNANMRLAPAFRRGIVGAETDNLSLSKKWSADELFVSHAVRPFIMYFVPKGGSAKSLASQAPENSSDSFSVHGEMTLPITDYRVVARGPFRTGVGCHGVDGLDVHLAKIIPLFRTARTSAGTVEQWSGVQVSFWMSSLSFDHQADEHWTEASELLLILYHPARHEILADMDGWYLGQYMAGTPIRLNTGSETLSLSESRIGTVDEHWLDETEMILVRGRFAGTLQRPLLLENLKVSK